MRPPHPAGMSTGRRPPEATPSVTLAPVATRRPGGDRPLGSSLPSPEVLLPTGDRLPRTPVSAPARALALDARRLLRRHADAAQRPPTWSDPWFEGQVAAVRRHLAPLRSRQALASSFARESFHHDRGRADTPDATDPVRLAYAIRWQELGRRLDARS
jgi:hypothetical protein